MGDNRMGLARSRIDTEKPTFFGNSSGSVLNRQCAYGDLNDCSGLLLPVRTFERIASANVTYQERPLSYTGAVKSNTELSQMMIGVLVHENGPLRRLQWTEERVRVA